MGLFGILLALAVLMWLAYRGWSILLVAPLAAVVAAAISGEPLLAHWTQTFMRGAARFRDGERIYGFTEEYSPNSLGFYFIPADPPWVSPVCCG